MAAEMTSPTAKKLRSKLWFAVLFLLVAGLVYFFWPRQANLREFNHAVVAKLETAMWRDYYEHKYLPLFLALYSLNRNEYGFSPWDSLRVSYFAAKGAKVFQPTHNRTEAQIALPFLERYFSIIRQRSGEQFDAANVAKLELDWWQLRREDKTAAEYGEVVAQVTTEVYGVNNDDVKQAALLRAEMMDYRDARRDGKMQAADWSHIEEGLARSYQLLKEGIHQTTSEKTTA